MKENKVLFQVSTQEGGTAVSCHVQGMEETFQVALAIHSLIAGSPTMAFMLSTIVEMSKKDPNFDKMLEEATIELPDFESILKNIK